MRKAELVVIALLVAVLAAQAQTAQKKGFRGGPKGAKSVPMLLNYQGYLAGSDTLPFTGQADMTFKIYDQPVGGIALWEESHVDLPVTKGFFNVALNSVAQTQFVDLFDGSQLYLETTVEGQVLAPRKPLSSVGYAFRAQRADMADSCSGVIGDKWAASGNNIYSTNSGNVGIGTASPGSNLHVYGNSNTGSPADNVAATIQSVNRNTVLQLDGSTAFSGNIVFYGAGAERGRIAYNNPGNYLAFHTNNTEKVRFDSGGNVGIGTTSPSCLLDVAGTTKTNYLVINPQLEPTEGGELALRGASTYPDWAVDVCANAFRLHTGGVGRLSIDATTGLMDVNGTTRTNGLIMPTGAASGYVLTSDATGAGTWQSISAGSHNHLGETWSSTDTLGLRINLNVNPTSGVVSTYGNRAEVNNTGIGWTYGGRFSVGGTGAGTKYGVYGSASGSGIIYGVFGAETAGGTGAAVYGAGDMACSGTKSAVVRTKSGERLVYCMESPEIWFEDVGEGQLSGGKVHIELDPLFLQTVTIDAKHPMKVFVQLNDENCNGVAVKRGTTGFDVIELVQGTSNASFSYRIVAKRKGYEEERMRVTDVGKDDPNLYPERRAEIEAKWAKERADHSRPGGEK